MDITTVLEQAAKGIPGSWFVQTPRGTKACFRPTKASGKSAVPQETALESATRKFEEALQTNQRRGIREPKRTAQAVDWARRELRPELSFAETQRFDRLLERAVSQSMARISADAKTTATPPAAPPASKPEAHAKEAPRTSFVSPVATAHRLLTEALVRRDTCGDATITDEVIAHLEQQLRDAEAAHAARKAASAPKAPQQTARPVSPPAPKPVQNGPPKLTDEKVRFSIAYSSDPRAAAEKLLQRIGYDPRFTHAEREQLFAVVKDEVCVASRKGLTSLVEIETAVAEASTHMDRHIARFQPRPQQGRRPAQQKRPFHTGGGSDVAPERREAQPKTGKVVVLSAAEQAERAEAHRTARKARAEASQEASRSLDKSMMASFGASKRQHVAKQAKAAAKAAKDANNGKGGGKKGGKRK